MSKTDDFIAATRRLQMTILRGTILVVLALGAAGSIFRPDTETKVISLIAIAILTVLAGVTVLREPKRPVASA